MKCVWCVYVFFMPAPSLPLSLPPSLPSLSLPPSPTYLVNDDDDFIAILGQGTHDYEKSCQVEVK